MARTKKWNVIIAIMLAIMLVLTGCGGNNTGNSANGAKNQNEPVEGNKNKTEVNGVDISEEVKLVFYLLGDAPVGMNNVVEKLNEKMKADINATVEFRYIGWGDLNSKYPLVVAAGEDVDLIYAANWAYYNQEAAKGAFREITMEDLKAYMPLHLKATPENAWEEAKVNGKINMVPTATSDQKVPVSLIRGDLRKKYNVPEIKKFNDIEPYLEAIKKNEKGMIPINMDSQYDYSKVFINVQGEIGPATVDAVLVTNGWTGTVTEWDDPDQKVHSLFDPYILDSYKKAATIVKSWYDKGYINKNAISNTVRSKDAFEQGKSAVAIGNSNDIQSTLAKAEEMGWEVEIIPNLSMKGTYPTDPHINNGVAIAAGSKHPERAMMALDLIMEEPSYNMLVYFGIEGDNYVMKDDKVALPEGVTSETNTYPPDAAGFWFTNKSQHPPLASWSDQYIEHKKSIKDNLIAAKFNTYTVDTSSMKSEVSNLNTVYTQYMLPIYGGIVKDVEQAFKVLEENAMKAGLEKVLTETTKQIKE